MVGSPANTSFRESTVREYVRRVWRVQVLRRASESMLVGVAALLVCLAASVASGARELPTETWIVSCAAAWLAASSWWLEHSPTEISVAQRLDGDGALVTAYECERSGLRTPIHALLSRRVVAAAAASSRRIARTPSAPVFAVLLAAGALLALSLESRPDPSSRVIDARRNALAERARALGSAAAADERPAGAAADVEQIARTAAMLATTRTSDPRLAGLAERAEQAARAPAESPRVRDALVATADAARELSAVLGGLSASELARNGGARPTLDAGERAQSTDGVPSAAADRAADPTGGDTATAASRESAAASGGDSRTDMPEGPPDVTMSRPDSGPASDVAASAAPERGLSGVRWWPRRFDAVVERWVEHERRSSDR